jgi:hypothetical protein
MKKLTFDWIKRPDGSSEFTDYVSSLNVRDKARLCALIAKTEQYGLDTALGMGWLSELDGGSYELVQQRQGSAPAALRLCVAGGNCLVASVLSK